VTVPLPVAARPFVDRLRAELHAVRRDRELTAAAQLLRGATALEPGGPSALFGRLGAIPVYSRVAALDILDYAEDTLWSSASDVGIAPRRRVIGEAGRLQGVPENSYDALLASHVIEHLADPLGALGEWSRVVRPGGHVLLIVPHRDGTFDHRRPVTSLEHLQADHSRQVAEEDLTHLDEILALHDLERDPGAPSRAVFEQRCRDNASTRAMHHHVFVSRTVAQLCATARLEVLLLRPEAPFNILCLCRVGEPRGEGLGEAGLSSILARSVFASDRADGD
jgi:SAM-dependent methyltransferase